MKTKRLQIEQIEKKMQPFYKAELNSTFSQNWIRAIRTTLGMSLEQLGQKLDRNKSSVARLEAREMEGAVTINTMQDAGRAMGMKFIYGFVPIDGSIDKLIEKEAKKLATEIVMRTSASMKLEDQENSSERIQKAIAERTKELIEEMPKKLWD